MTLIVRRASCGVLTLSFFVSLFLSGGWTQTIEWTRQLGTGMQDKGQRVSADRFGNVYISGYTEGRLGNQSFGGFDAFLSKYDAGGTLQWTQQFGTDANEFSYGVSADDDGNVYISGSTSGSLGGPLAGITDAFISKYNASGALLWARQLGTSAADHAYGASADHSGNVYISGFTQGDMAGPNKGDYDAIVSKYNSDGELQWTRQLGTNRFENGLGVSADGLGNVYITGLTEGFLGTSFPGGDDAYLAKFNAAGTWLWTRQLGTTTYDWSGSVSADTLGNVFISGVTRGNLEGKSAGPDDAFVAKYDSDGSLQWTRQFGTVRADGSQGVAVDGSGGVYVTGITNGDLITGSRDAFVGKYDASGTLCWMRQVGSVEYEESKGISFDGSGSIYITGYTFGQLGGANQGLEDAFITKFVEVPEPNITLQMTLMIVVGFYRRRIKGGARRWGKRTSANVECSVWVVAYMRY
jgi:hypothetical protein